MSGNACYTVHPMYPPFPDEKLATQGISRFGPAGMGIELRQPAFTMRVNDVEEGEYTVVEIPAMNPWGVLIVKGE